MTQTSLPASEAARTPGASSAKYKLAFASIGVVFGDIGTSPLYAMRLALQPIVNAGGDVRSAVFGVVSLLVWSVITIVTIKYVYVIMRADNRGEGGILSLVVLIESLFRKKGGLPLVLGIIGASFFFGDAIITPGHVGPVSRGRTCRHQQRPAGICPSAYTHDPHRAFHFPVQGHRRRWQALRARLRPYGSPSWLSWASFTSLMTFISCWR